VSDRPKSSKKSPRQPNRAQRRAQQVRIAETNAPAPLDMAVVLDQEALVEAPATAPILASRRPNRRQAAQQVSYVLPREVEYAYIRADLRRLIITAGALLALMLLLLFLVD
jgi:hypothetical protein